MTFSQDMHLRQYLLAKEIKNVSSKTLDTYDKKLSRFLLFVEKPANQVTSADVSRYIEHLRANKCTIDYIDGIYRTLQTFYTWLTQKGFITTSPMNGIDKPIVPKKVKEFLTDEEFETLLKATAYDTFTGHRNTAWLWLLWTTGARFEELATLHLNDVDWKQARIHIREGKGRKERYVPFTKRAQRAMYEYVARRPVNGIPDLWLSEEHTNMGYWGMFQATRRIYTRAGITKKDMHHIFRRSWAWRQLKANISPKFVRLIGGWESSEMIDRYVRAMTSQDCLDQVSWDN